MKTCGRFTPAHTPDLLRFRRIIPALLATPFLRQSAYERLSNYDCRAAGWFRRPGRRRSFLIHKYSSPQREGESDGRAAARSLTWGDRGSRSRNGAASRGGHSEVEAFSLTRVPRDFETGGCLVHRVVPTRFNHC